MNRKVEQGEDVTMTLVGLFHGRIGGIGGGEHVAISLARELTDAGYRVRVFVYNGSENNSALKIFREVLPPGAEIITYSPHRLKMFGIYQKLLAENFIRSAERNSDIIVQTSGGLQPIIRSKRRRIAYFQALWQVRSDANDTKYQHGFWRLYYLPYGYITTRRLLTLSNLEHLVVVANSMYTKQHLLNVLNLDDSEVSVIYPPVNIKKWAVYDDASIKRNGIINVARFSPEKNHSVIFDGVKDLSARLTLIGNTTNATTELYLKSLERIAPANTRFLNNIHFEQILTELHKAKVYLHTSAETFGLTVVEAIAAGCVPVVPNNSAHKETVPFPELRYDSFEDAQQKIRDALNDNFDHLLPKLKRHIQQFDESNFNSKMRNMIEKVLAERVN